MARTFGRFTQELNPASFEHKPSGELFTVLSRQGNSYLERHQEGPGGKLINQLERRLDYWFGSGNHARSFLSRNVSGDLIELPLTWYAEKGGHWGMSPAYDVAAHSGFSRKITYRCMFCHNAYPDVPAGADRSEIATNFPAELPQGIDCQRCHGPGQQHADAARRGKPSSQVRAAILNPATLTPQRQAEVCMQCHLETTSLRLPGSIMRYGRTVFSYRPGEPLTDYNLYFDHDPNSAYAEKFEFVSSAYRLRQSSCFRATGGRLTCTTCHDPHGNPSNFTRACIACHSAKLEQLIKGKAHSTAQDCISCHMPKRQPSDAIHVRVTDHYIGTYPVQAVVQDVEQNEANSPAYRGKVATYYPATIDALYLGAAQVRNEANLDEGIALLESTIAQSHPSGGGFYADLSGAYRQAGKPFEALALMREAAFRSPTEWNFFRILGQDLIAAGAFGDALTAIKRAIQIAPRESSPLEALADLQARQSKFTEAATTLHNAAAIDPDSATIQNNLGTALLRTGQLASAEAALREAERLRPELASIRINLGTFLSRTGRFPGAQDEFEAAIRFSPQSAEAHSAYGTELASNGKLADARDHFQAALRLNPNLANTHNNLGTVLRQLGDSDAAIREYLLAIAAQPGLATAHLNLGILLASRNEFDEAIVHLRRAAESTDPEIRQPATDLLRKIK